MEKIVKIASSVPRGVKRDDDAVDRLSHRYTVLLLVTFTIIIATSIYVGSPINCWCDKHFTGNHIKYTNSYCWVRNTYKLSFDEDIPKQHQSEEKEYIIYYQWMPFILLGQALFFYLPTLVWHGFNQKAGVDCDSILEAANKLQRTVQAEKRQDMKDLISRQMHHFLNAHASESSSNSVMSLQCIQRCFCCSAKGGFFLVVLYIFSKILFVLNVCMQLYLLNLVLRTSYSVYGWEFLWNVIDDDTWVNSPAFPRITMCDFSIRRIGNIHSYTVQCVLPINMYTEKIYAFLWFWMVFVAFISVLNLVIWLGRIFIKSDRVRYILEHTEEPEDMNERARKEEATEFVDAYLGQDGVFILRMIGHNCNRHTICEIAQGMLEHWRAVEAAANRASPSRYSDESLPLKSPTAPGEEDDTVV